MSFSDESGPAFPTENTHQTGPTTMHHEGMSLRDYFAAQALTAIDFDDLYFGTAGKPENPWPWVAHEAYRAADAMLEARKEQP